MKDFIVSALNNYWFEAHKMLQSKTLGDIERQQYTYQLEESKRVMNLIEDGKVIIQEKKKPKGYCICDTTCLGYSHKDAKCKGLPDSIK